MLGEVTPDPVVRGYLPQDRAGVEILWAQAFPDDPPRNDPAAILARKLEMNDGLIFVAEADGRVVAAVMAGWDGFRGWIYHLAVDQDYRRGGIATLVMRAAEAELARRGCRKINLQVRRSNEAVVALYESLGFVVEPQLSMGKVIAP